MYDVDFNVKVRIGFILLYFVVFNGYEKVVNFLLIFGCNGNVLDGSGRSVMFFVSRGGYVFVIEVFFKYGIKFN